MSLPTPPLNKKVLPTLYLGSGWVNLGDAASWYWNNSPQATLNLLAPNETIRYVFAEVSALNNAQADHPQTISIAVNDVPAEEWVIDSTVTHDKFIIIPQGLIRSGQPVTITFVLAHPADATSEKIGINLRSIAFHTNLNAYLNELQTGYNWVCGIRDELLEKIRQVVFFLNNIDSPPPQLTSALRGILQDPFVAARHYTKVTFDEHYFQIKRAQLKDGYIHQSIRLWLKDLERLQEIVIDAGNYATRQPEIHCWDNAGLTQLSPSKLDFSAKIVALRHKNTTLNNLEILLRKDTLGSIPPVLYLDITNRCNFRCRMCYQSTSHFLRQNLINEHMAIILDMLPYLTDITVAGLGEPLLSKNLIPLADRAKELHCHTSIITNGSLILNNLLALKRFSSVSISFDGAEADTFETLRNRSNFNQIIKNIRQLRKESSSISIALSVVLSRANLDELARIVQLATELGVNVINVTPLEHMPLLELKRSDLSLFEAQLAEGQRLAEQAGITLSVAIGPRNFNDSDDTPRDKKGILSVLASMNPAPEKNAQVEDIADGLQTTPFRYYPNSIVFVDQPILERTTVQPTKAGVPSAIRPEFDIDLEIRRLDQQIESCLKAIRELAQPSFTLPYCLDPWKLNYVKSNGKNRLCCHTDHIVGDTGSTGFRNAINSERYRQLRRAMTGSSPLLDACKKCRAQDRALGFESVLETCREFGLPLPPKLRLESNT